MTFLETERLLFRQHELSDEADFVRMHMDPEVRRYMGGAGWPLGKAQYRFHNQYLGRPTETYGLWAAILKEGGKFIGSCGLRAGQNGKEAHLGYFLARPYWGGGLATEASQAFIGVAFNRLGLRQLLADVEEGNTVSEHILKKFGFTYVSREEIAANRRVICFYALSREAWQRKTA